MYFCGAHRDGWSSKEGLRRQKGREEGREGMERKKENKREGEEKYGCLLQS